MIEFNVIDEKENKLLKRKEIKLLVRSNSTPRKDEILSLIKADPSVSSIKKIISGFGKREFLVNLFLYDSPEDKSRIEYIPKKIRKKMLENQKAEEEKKKGGTN